MKRLVITAIASAVVWFGAPVNAQVTHVGAATVSKVGNGTQAVVLIPGLGGGPFVFDGVAAELARRYTVYTITFAGFDGTATVAAPYLDAYEKTLSDLIHAERLIKPILVGHSLGGHIAVRFAERESANIGGIVAIDAVPLFPMPQPGDTAEGRMKNAAAMRDAMIAAPAERYALMTRVSIGYLVSDPAALEIIVAHSLRADRTTFAGAAYEMSIDDLRPQLRAITAPVLVLAAAPSVEEAPQYMAAYSEAYAGTKHLSVEAIAPSKHFIMYDQPGEFRVRIDRFIAGIAR